jgi:regulator of protease activity HflC (stomatin/prohibitin superfamily)
MNNINASQRNQIAAAAQGDAQKILAVLKAEGEKETMRLQGEGIAEERKAIAEGLKESLQIIADQGLDIKEAMALVALTQYTDMIRALGEGSQTNTILLPHSPSAVGELMDQIRNGIMVADLTTDRVAAASNQQPQLNGGTAQLSGGTATS